MGWMDLTDVHPILVLWECEVPLRGLHRVTLDLHEGWTTPGLAFVNGPCHFLDRISCRSPVGQMVRGPGSEDVIQHPCLDWITHSTTQVSWDVVHQ